MKKFLFWISILLNTLLVIFLFSSVSLNGYKTDFYFFLISLFINLFTYLKLYKDKKTKRKSYINFCFALLQIPGLVIFLQIGVLQVDKVYQPMDNKYNLYSSITGWYKRTYFKRNTAELCGDGELWHTKVPYYFPIIEIETSRDQCHIVGKDSTYSLMYKHIPE